jgi:hypothetical protein
MRSWWWRTISASPLSPATLSISFAPSEACSLISSYSHSVRAPGLRRTPTGTAIFPTSCSIAAVRSVRSASPLIPIWEPTRVL